MRGRTRYYRVRLVAYDLISLASWPLKIPSPSPTPIPPLAPHPTQFHSPRRPLRKVRLLSEKKQPEA